MTIKDMFPYYFNRPDKYYKALWAEALFVVDTNVLFSLYRFTDESRESLIDYLQRLEGNLWVPHQVAEEFARGRKTVIDAQKRAFKEVKAYIKHLQSEANAKFDKLMNFRDHSIIDKAAFKDRILEVCAELDKLLIAQEMDLQISVEQDPILDRVDDLLNEKIGPAYSQKQLRDIYDEGVSRYQHEIPPGYEDARKKSGHRKYGDLVLWYQIIDKAKASKRPIIFITNDGKPDWWQKEGRNVLAPHPMLIEELKEMAGVDFHMYLISGFSDQAAKHFELPVDEGVAKEAEEMRQHDEALEQADLSTGTGMGRPYPFALSATPEMQAIARRGINFESSFQQLKDIVGIDVSSLAANTLGAASAANVVDRMQSASDVLASAGSVYREAVQGFYNSGIQAALEQAQQAYPPDTIRQWTRAIEQMTRSFAEIKPAIPSLTYGYEPDEIDESDDLDDSEDDDDETETT